MVINPPTADYNWEGNQALLTRSLVTVGMEALGQSASVDVDGLRTSERMDAQMQSITAAKVKVSHAIFCTQSQERYLNKLAAALDRMSQLSLLAQDETKSDNDRSIYNSEYSQLGASVRNAARALKLASPCPTPPCLNAAVGPEAGHRNACGVDVHSSAYLAVSDSNISTRTAAVLALTHLDAALNQLCADRATVGAYQTSLNLTVEQITVSRENLRAVTSWIKSAGAPRVERGWL